MVRRRRQRDAKRRIGAVRWTMVVGCLRRFVCSFVYISRAADD